MSATPSPTAHAPDSAEKSSSIIGALPGEKRAYGLRDGQGEHHLVGGQVATLIARASDSGGAFEATILTGGVGAALPFHRHARTHEALFVLDGQVELRLGDDTFLLSRGDYASIPPGVPHGHQMASHRTRLLTLAVGGSTSGLYAALGEPFSRAIQPETAGATIAAARLRAAVTSTDVVFEPTTAVGPARPVDGAALPPNIAPYALRSGEGERLIVADQMFTLLGTQANSGGAFIVVMTEGPPGRAIPPHYHDEHTENFLCLDGLMTMMVNGEEFSIHPGDYLHVPAGAIHSYRLDAPYTRFIGWLAPGLFEPFFRTIGDPYAPYVFPVTPPPFRFDRVLARLGELDVHFIREGARGPPA